MAWLELAFVAEIPVLSLSSLSPFGIPCMYVHNHWDKVAPTTLRSDLEDCRNPCIREKECNFQKSRNPKAKQKENSSLSIIDWVHYWTTFVLNDCTHLIQCVKKQSLLIVSSPSISELSCSLLFHCVLDPDFHVYNIDSVPDILNNNCCPWARKLI